MTDQSSGTDSVVAPGELDDDDGGGLVGFLMMFSSLNVRRICICGILSLANLRFLQSLTARSRALLMQKLDRSGTVQK